LVSEFASWGEWNATKKERKGCRPPTHLITDLYWSNAQINITLMVHIWV
jgi:hypothetical protein